MFKKFNVPYFVAILNLTNTSPVSGSAELNVPDRCCLNHIFESYMTEDAVSATVNIAVTFGERILS